MRKVIIEYLKERGWVIKGDSAYKKKDINFVVPYSIEGTYKLYVNEVYDESVRGDN